MGIAGGPGHRHRGRPAGRSGSWPRVRSPEGAPAIVEQGSRAGPAQPDPGHGVRASGSGWAAQAWSWPRGHCTSRPVFRSGEQQRGGDQKNPGRPPVAAVSRRRWARSSTGAAWSGRGRRSRSASRSNASAGPCSRGEHEVYPALANVVLELVQGRRRDGAGEPADGQRLASAVVDEHRRQRGGLARANRAPRSAPSRAGESSAGSAAAARRTGSRERRARTWVRTACRTTLVTRPHRAGDGRRQIRQRGRPPARLRTTRRRARTEPSASTTVTAPTAITTGLSQPGTSENPVAISHTA